jgi:hypothetical protein
MEKVDKTMFASVLFLTIIGLFVRLSAPLTAELPINDGGLFYVMIQDVRTNHYSLPFATTYNQAGIPFAYPPLSFYLYGLLADATRIPLLDLIRVLPAFISALTIPAFYLLAKEILNSKLAIFSAVFAFSLIPRAYDWIIMGGGVTRALGFLFALLALRQVYRLFTKGTQNDLLLAVTFSTLVVYSHPEAIVHTIIGSVFFYLWKDRSRRGFVQSVAVAFSVLLLTAPWWWTIISRYGISILIAPLTAVQQDNISIPARLFSLFQFQFSDEPLLSLFGVLGLLGLFFLAANKQYFVPTWIIVTYLIEPRSAPLYIMAPLAMAIGFGLGTVIFPGMQDKHEINPSDAEAWSKHLLSGQTLKVFFGFVFIYGLISNIYLSSRSLSKFMLTQQDLMAFHWAEENTSTDSKFILITQENPLLDPTSDWFPALSNQKSIATVYGYEWVNDGLFGKRLENARSLQNCATQDVACLIEWQIETGHEYSHVYIRKTRNGSFTQVPIIAYLELSSDHEKVYETINVVIFHKK